MSYKTFFDLICERYQSRKYWLNTRFGNRSLCLSHSHHFLDECINELLSVSKGAVSLSESVSLDLESSERGRKLEWPQEIVSFLELRSAGNNLMNEVLNAVDSVLTELTGNDAIVSEWNS